MEIIDISTFVGSWPNKAIDMSVERLLTLMRKHAISRALVVSAKGIWYDYIEGNTETMSLARAREELIPVGTIDPRKYYKRGEVKRLKESGVKICRLFNDIQGWLIDYAPLRDIVEEFERYRMPFMIDVSKRGVATQVGRLAREVDVPIIMTSPGYDLMSELIAVMRKNNNLFVEMRRINSPDVIEILAEEIGVERMVYGSNSPFDNVESSLLMLLGCDLTEREKEKIASGNIRNILGFR